MISRKPNGRNAAAAVELAVLLPFLMYICVISTDWARIMHLSIALEGCARNGAMYASDPITAAQSPYPSLEAASLAEAPGIQPTPTVSSRTTTNSAGNPSVVVTVSATFRTLSDFPGVPASQTVSRSVEMRIAPTAARYPGSN